MPFLAHKRKPSCTYARAHAHSPPPFLLYLFLLFIKGEWGKIFFFLFCFFFAPFFVILRLHSNIRFFFIFTSVFTSLSPPLIPPFPTSLHPHSYPSLPTTLFIPPLPTVLFSSPLHCCATYRHWWQGLRQTISCIFNNVFFMVSRISVNQSWFRLLILKNKHSKYNKHLFYYNYAANIYTNLHLCKKKSKYLHILFVFSVSNVDFSL